MGGHCGLHALPAANPSKIDGAGSPMRYWLLKSEPFKYGWDDLIAEKEGTWDGVRNHRAKNNLAAMEVGDLALIPI